MSARELGALIGKLVYLEARQGLWVLCLIADAKSAYGSVRYKLEAPHGKGAAWVNAKHVEFLTPEESAEVQSR